MAARKGPAHLPAKVSMSHDHRLKIQNSNILNALIEHALGERDMKPSQVAAGLGLLKKVLPDLQSTELKGEGGEPLIPRRLLVEYANPKADASKSN